MPESTAAASATVALAPLREALLADGADLLVEHADAETVTVVLQVRDARCAECILPTEHLRAVVEDALRHLYPGRGQITMRDPRTS